MPVFHVLVRYTQRDTDSDPVDEIYTEDDAPDMPSAVFRVGQASARHWDYAHMRGVDIEIVSVMDDSGQEYTAKPFADQMRGAEYRCDHLKNLFPPHCTETGCPNYAGRFVR